MFVVDPRSTVPPYEQLRQQVVNQVSDGTLVPGTQLPTVRRLATNLGLAPNTVARTYRELEQSGVVRTAGRRGTVVARPSADFGEDARKTAQDFVRRMRALGIAPAEALRLVRQSFEPD